MTDAAGYTRLSQQSDLSIPRQKENIREYCDENGFSLIDIFDDGEESSGFDSERPAYQTLLDEVRDEQVGLVVLNDKRRIARDVDEVMRLVPDFREAGVELHTVRGGKLEIDDPLRAAIEIVSAAAAHEEKMEEIEKSIQSIREKQERGDDLGRPRFGMEYDDSSPPKQVPGYRFEYVVTILEMRDQGESYLAIADELDISKSQVYRVVQRREWYDERTDTNSEIIH